MMYIWLVLGACASFAASGLAGALPTWNARTGQRIAALLMALGSVLGLTGLALSLASGTVPSLECAWLLPWGHFHVALDALGGVFLALVLVIPTLGAFYGLGYWKADEHADNSRRLGFVYGLMTAAMVLVVVARDGVLFLIAWELMAIAGFFAATAEDDKAEVRKAGWIYLVATHFGTLFLLIMFALWGSASGSFELAPDSAMPQAMATAIFAFSFVGFGFKAGVMPLHVWLPGEHANAPCHVAAVMSGVMCKMGVYGIVRMSSLLTVNSEWWGYSVLAVGALSGIGGIVFASGQRDLKRVLAYSSIENIGIITMGIGLALLGRFFARMDLVVLGLGAALFHVWNHGLFKPLMFFGAGAVVDATGTAEIEKLGGLGKRMPGLMVLFVVGAAAISALPPLNGFAGEWYLYLGFFKTFTTGAQGIGAATALSAAALAMIGALALACFVKLVGTVFLGGARGESGAKARDPGAAMLVPMVILALGCVALGFFPPLVQPLLEAAIRTWLPPGVYALGLEALAPSRWLGILGAALLVAIALVVLVTRLVPRLRAAPRRATWDCGYAKPHNRIQYTGTSFTQGIARLFAFMLRPKTELPELKAVFPKRTRFGTTVPDLVLDGLVLPVFGLLGRNFPRIRVFQQGRTQMYILYVVVITILLMLFATVRGLS